MIKSMTGFGQGVAEADNLKARVELRTVNNRFLDIHMRLPQELSSLEITLKKQIQASLKRGRVDVTMVVEQQRQARFEINRPLVTGYLSALSELQTEFGLSGEPSLELLAKLPGALQVSQDTNHLDETVVSSIARAVDGALDALTQMRIAEGRELAAELVSRLAVIEAQLPSVEARVERLPALYREKLMKRVQDLLPGGALDESRIAQEAVLLADRSDISEEIARLKSHISQMREAIQVEEEAGKRLDFILQEMNREANTILSKSNDLEIGDAGIVIKTEVEKLREQVQNVE